MSGKRSVIMLTTGEPGAGKSYTRGPYFLLFDFLRNRRGHFYTNLPIGDIPETHHRPPEYEGETFADRIARGHAKFTGRKDDAEFIQQTRDRLHIIPEDVLETWMHPPAKAPTKQELAARGFEGIGFKDGMWHPPGPWDYFKDKDLSGAHITLDEFHEFASRNHPAYYKLLWQTWTGQIRHRGATLELISQDHEGIAKEVLAKCGQRLAIVPPHHVTDSFTNKITMHDWHELLASITRSWQACVYEVTYSKYRFIPPRKKKIRYLDSLFDCYNSHSAPTDGSGEGGTEELNEWQKRSAPGLWWWWFWRYWDDLIFNKPALGIIGVFLFFLALKLGLLDGLILGFGKNIAGAAGADAIDGQETAQADQPAPQTPEQLAAASEIEQARQQAEQYRQQAKQAEHEAHELRRKAARMSALVLMSPDGVLLATGERVKVGESVKFGPMEGQILAEINYGASYATFTTDDSEPVLLRLGSSVPLESDDDGTDDHEDTGDSGLVRETPATTGGGRPTIGKPPSADAY